MVGLRCKSGWVFMDVGAGGVVVDVDGAVELGMGVDVWVHLKADSEYVEVSDVEDFQFHHEGLGMCSG